MKKMKKIRRKNSNIWLDVSIKLLDQLPDAAGLVCPNCGAASIGYQYFGDPATRVGTVMIWCNECLTGTHWSRVTAPQCVELLPFGASTEHIPDFRQI